MAEAERQGVAEHPGGLEGGHASLSAKVSDATCVLEGSVYLCLYILKALRRTHFLWSHPQPSPNVGGRKVGAELAVEVVNGEEGLLAWAEGWGCSGECPEQKEGCWSGTHSTGVKL